MRHIVLAATAVVVLGGTAAAQQRVKEAIISDAAAAAWVFEGAPKTRAVGAPAGVPGGKAIQVTIAQKGVNPWAVQARLPMKDGLAAGDTATFGFYARAKGGTATVHVRLQRNVAPYDAALEGPVAIGQDWSFVCLSGPAKLTLGAAELVASVQLAGAKQVIELGPYMATRIPAQGAGVRSGLPCGRAVAG